MVLLSSSDLQHGWRAKGNVGSDLEGTNALKASKDIEAYEAWR